MLILGDQEKSTGTVSVRYRSGEQKKQLSFEDFVAEVGNAVGEKL